MPPLPPDQVGLLATVDAGGRPHSIPVSALHRADGRRLLVALAGTRGGLARLRARPDVALALLGPGFSLTAHGRARVAADPLPGAEHVVAVELRVERVADTLGTRTRIDAGVRWGWIDPTSDERHAQTLEALARLT